MGKMRAHGFVFLTVLIFLQLFSLMGLYGLMHSATTIKINQHSWQREMDLFTAQHILHELEENFLHGNITCVIHRISATTLIYQPVSWWQQYACRDHANEIEYYYAVEVMGKDPCGGMSMVDQSQIVIPKYYRITLFMLSANIKNAKIILQSTIVKPTDEISACAGKMHQVMSGRQMWREI